MEQITGKTVASVYKLIADMQKLEILQELTGGQRKRLYAFKEYIDLF